MFLIFYVLCRISELIERETAEYHKADPDPFDDRHPGHRTFLPSSRTTTRDRSDVVAADGE